MTHPLTEWAEAMAEMYGATVQEWLDWGTGDFQNTTPPGPKLKPRAPDAWIRRFGEDTWQPIPIYR